MPSPKHVMSHVMLHVCVHTKIDDILHFLMCIFLNVYLVVEEDFPPGETQRIPACAMCFAHVLILSAQLLTMDCCWRIMAMSMPCLCLVCAMSVGQCPWTFGNACGNVNNFQHGAVASLDIPAWGGWSPMHWKTKITMVPKMGENVLFLSHTLTQWQYLLCVMNI